MVLAGIAPFFIVENVDQTTAFYREKLGFDIAFQQPNVHPFFAVLRRDDAQLFVKSHTGVKPVPNQSYHEFLRWDAFVSAPDPDGLAAEFAERGLVFSEPLQDTHDGLRGFEVTDPDGHVLFFGRTR